MNCLLVDFGSTYTKVTVFDLAKKELIGRAQSPTTIHDDVNIGLNKALDNLKKDYGVDVVNIDEMYACSSAAGGLRMVAIGLIPTLTLEAAKRAALGAGAKVVASYAYKLGEEDVGAIEKLNCDIIMLCGGTDGGNKNVILHNSAMLAKSNVDCPILVCGNKVVSYAIKGNLEAAGKRAYISDNVLPQVNRVEVGPAQQMIREIFIEHIVKAKGLDKAAERFCRPIIPTPVASLRAAELLADGSDNVEGIGSLLIVEIGGATTNVHSVENIRPVTAQTVIRGLCEDRLTRTVEGDMGIRYNARTIYEIVGGEKLKQLVFEMCPDLNESQIDLDEYTALLNENVEHVPQTQEEYIMDAALAHAAAEIAVCRHAGTVHCEYASTRKVIVQNGKNLMEVRNVLGMGGIFKYGRIPEQILKSAMYSTQTPENLKPMKPMGWLDKEYIMYAVGLISRIYPDEALTIAKKYLSPVHLDEFAVCLDGFDITKII